MNLEMFMFLLYVLSLLCFCCTGVLLFRMGAPVLFKRIGKSLWREVLNRSRHLVIAGVIPAVLLSAANAEKTRAWAAESFPQEAAESAAELPEMSESGAELPENGEHEPEQKSKVGRLELFFDGIFYEEEDTYYCNASSCGIIAEFSYENLHDSTMSDGLCFVIAADGEKLSEMEISQDEQAENGHIYSFQLTAAEVAGVLEEGEHEIEVSVYEGERKLLSDIVKLVYDTTPPVLHARLLTNAENRIPVDDRFYLNADVMFELYVEEEHYDRDRFRIQRDYASEEQQDTRSAAVNCEGESIRSETGLFRDLLDTDGVWAYRIFGTDKAGNAPVAYERRQEEIPALQAFEDPDAAVFSIEEDILTGPAQSAVIVRDTQAPQGILTVYAGSTLCYRMNERGTVTAGDIFYDTDEIAVCAEAVREKSPVRIGGTILRDGESFPFGSGMLRNEKTEEPDDEAPVYSMGAVCEKKLPAGDAFAVKGLWLRDLAGNETVFPDSDELRPHHREQAEEDEGEAAGKDEKQAVTSEAESREEDRAGGTEQQQETFPEFSVTYINNNVRNGYYFRRPRTAVIRVRKGSVEPGRVRISAEGGTADQSWRDEDGYYVKYVTFLKNGTCSLDVYAIDRSGNRIEAQQVNGTAAGGFIIDRMRPVIAVEGLRDRSANAALPDRIRLRVKDTYAADCEISMELRTGVEGKTEKIAFGQEMEEGELVLVPELPAEDEYYALITEAVDPAGNLTRRKVAYSINSAGTTFEFRQSEVCGRTVNQPFIPEIVLHDTDEVKVLSAAVNGKEAEISREGDSLYFDHIPAEDGIYRLTLTTKDSAGHVNSMEPVEFTLDTTPPAVTISLPEELAEYKGNVRAVVTTNDEEAVLKSIRLDGEKTEYTEGDEPGIWYVEISSPGSHVLAVRCADQAGNVSAEVQCEVTVRKADFRETAAKGMLLLGSLLAAAASGLRIKQKMQ
ncbi:MAG: hypothetical protein Q4B09_01325 [Lachnospiraceae bacterium]|nr:hypothetical protein [Lachnospiraceae bacterium]